VKTPPQLWLPLLLLTFSFAVRAQQVENLASPDGQISLAVQIPAAGSGEPPVWSATFRAEALFKNCRLGLKTQRDGDLLKDAKVVRLSRRTNNERIPVLFGKADHAQNDFQELQLEFSSAREQRVYVVFRCYNDAIAFRYEIPGSGAEATTIADENSTFRVEGNPKAYVQYLENFQTSHEHRVTATTAEEISSGILLDLPLTFSWSNGTYAAITEAALRSYAGMSLSRENTELVCKLTPLPDGNKVIHALPLVTPWRVVSIGANPGALLESETIYALNDPPAGDFSWVKPGKLTFSWWNGDVFDGKPGSPILSFEMARKYIDFCASNRIAFHAMTSTENTVTPWYHQSKAGVEPGPDTDVTRPRDGFELSRIRDYAQGRGVRMWTWVHQKALRGRVEEAFAAFEKMGWSGMMVDFFDHDDQGSVEHAEAILAAAARHHILIHLHGIWKPTGLERTYPNLMNHEGALNLEYLKWSDLCTPEHDVMMAFTRLLAGPMDYHLGGFRAVRKESFKPRNVAPQVLGTRCHQLSLYLCFNNPSPMVADYPAAYTGQKGFDFVSAVPTWWDETRVLRTDLGELLITGRRKASEWWIGGLAAKQSRQVDLPLKFLGAGSYELTLWRDGPAAEQDPNDLSQETKIVSSKETLSVHIATDGGFVARLKPMAR
jgi:alpha-glucosidase